MALLTGGYIPTKQTGHDDGFFNPFYDTAEGRAQSGYNGPGPVWSIANGGWVQGGSPAQQPTAPSAPDQPGAMNPLGVMGGNPYQSQVADDMQRRTQQGLDQSFNAIRGHAVGVGGLGGSRQGVAEGLATRGAMDNLQGNLAGMYSTNWNADQNRNLSQYGMDQNFYTAQRGQDLAQTGMGADIYSKALQDGWFGINNANGVYNTTAGNNVSTTGDTKQGGGPVGAVGAGLGTYQMGHNMGWW